MYLGAQLALRTKNELNTLHLGFGIIIGIAIQFIEAFYLSRRYQVNAFEIQFLFGTLIASITIFLMCEKIKIKDNIFSTWGREYSLFIYVFHPLIYFLTWFFVEKVAPVQLPIIKVFAPIIGFAITLLFAILVNKYLPRIFKLLCGEIPQKRNTNLSSMS